MAPGRDLLAYNDPLLARLLCAQSEADAAGEIERLLARVTPAIVRTVRAAAKDERQLPAEDIGDVVATITLRLLIKLQALRTSHQEAVLHFDDYLASLSANAVYDQVRRQFPERTRLRNRLRYILTRDCRLAVWDTPSGTLCGLQQWNGQTFFTRQVSLTRATATEVMLDHARPADALEEIFRHLRRPVRFALLVELVAELWQVADVAPRAPVPSLPDPAPGQLSTLQTREVLAAAWSELLQLPPRQRAALLLNLRSSHAANALTLIAITAVATFEEVAEAIGMTPDALMGIWNTLPLEDNRIAEILGCARQQVINLRKAARARLSRRLALLLQPPDETAGHGPTRDTR